MNLGGKLRKDVNCCLTYLSVNKFPEPHKYIHLSLSLSLSLSLKFQQLIKLHISPSHANITDNTEAQLYILWKQQSYVGRQNNSFTFQGIACTVCIPWCLPICFQNWEGTAPVTNGRKSPVTPLPSWQLSARA